MNAPHATAPTSLSSPGPVGQPPRHHVAVSGLPDLDALLDPLGPGTFTLLAGRAMAGTSALLLTIARHNSRQGLPVALAALQGTPSETGRMLLAAESSRCPEHSADASHLAAVRARLRRLPLRLIGPDGDVIRRLRAEAVAGAGLLLLDDLALAAGPSGWPGAGAVASALAATARELSVPIIATAHLGPGHGTTPRPEDLRDPHVHEHVDRIVLLHRPARLGPVPGQPDLVSLHVTGPKGTGRATVRFEPEHHRMTNS
ncbi:DnaB-like helicase C-terminal domain-containing protein [Streptomyces sp. MS1.AVA.3]|uniref:DnaB-like helicase C-terminal domain-containing protein n=1 Tax=Streptomyces decoyicus TaxID=249567 RepID=UPI0030C1576A